MFSDKKNKDTQINMEGMNCTLYREKKRKNVTVCEIIRSLIIMLRISIDPQNMGGYPP